jgi:hypothetical protein
MSDAQIRYHRGDKVEVLVSWSGADVWEPGVVMYADRCEVIVWRGESLPTERTPDQKPPLPMRRTSDRLRLRPTNGS